jgi:hypothetical protein
MISMLGQYPMLGDKMHSDKVSCPSLLFRGPNGHKYGFGFSDNKNGTTRTAIQAGAWAHTRKKYETTQHTNKTDT